MRYEKTLAIQNRHDRLLELLRTGKFSSRDLAEKLEVSEQTIYRDVNFLKTQGHSIRPEKHADGWAYHLHSEPATVSAPKGSVRK